MYKTSDLIPHLSGHLAAQRWYAGGVSDPVKVAAERSLLSVEGADVRWMLVDAGGARYQLVLGARPESDDLSFLHGSNGEVARIDGVVVYDAVLDSALGLALLHEATAGREQAAHVRPVGAEQSNTSLVYDDRLILKLFRRLHAGANPDIEMAATLAAAGFDHVPAPVAVWRYEGLDLAVVQPFLAGSTEGWALALTSLRDLYGSACKQPEECGGDFGSEARRLGEVTALLHLASARALGPLPAGPSGSEAMLAQLEAVARDEPWAPAAAAVFREAARDGGSLIRVHGDLHLGQVLRVDQGWFVLDFEGEPARPIQERTAPSSPLKDVAGMIRSFHYATQVALAERADEERKELEVKAESWERHNRESFLRGYLSTPGILDLLPADEGTRALQLDAWELDKAIYELAYERAYRPAWEPIPLSAIERLLGRRAP